MFGYIRPVESELLVKEYEFYRAVYCSLCKTGGRRVSRFSRFFLNYDFVFLALVRLALTREQVSTERTFCPYRLKKKTVLAENDAVTYTTAAFGLLSYYKLCDDIADLRGFRRLKKRLLLPLFSRMAQKSRTPLSGAGQAGGCCNGSFFHCRKQGGIRSGPSG